MANRRKGKRYENDRLESGLTQVDDSGGVGELRMMPMTGTEYSVLSWLLSTA